MFILNFDVISSDSNSSIISGETFWLWILKIFVRLVSLYFVPEIRSVAKGSFLKIDLNWLIYELSVAAFS